MSLEYLKKINIFKTKKTFHLRLYNCYGHLCIGKNHTNNCYVNQTISDEIRRIGLKNIIIN